MNDNLRSAVPVNQEVTGEPVEAYGYVVTPVARVRGRVGSMDDENGSGRYGWAAIRPVKVNVLDRNGNAQELRITNVEQQAMLAMAILCVLLTLFSALLPVFARAQREQKNDASLAD